MFNSLSQEFERALRNLSGKGRLSRADLDSITSEMRRALLAADVDATVANGFQQRVGERVAGVELSRSINPVQQVLNAAYEELISLLGSEAFSFSYASKPPTVVLMVGLQGAGKTTSAAKLASWCKSDGRQPLLVGADLNRPAAVEQLRILGRQIGVPVFSASTDPVSVATQALAEARSTGRDVVIIDTAGRQANSDALMAEINQISKATSPKHTFLVVDAMTGQSALSIAKTFHTQVAFDGVVLSKLDGDARGGVALSIGEVIGTPIAFVGTGERLHEFDRFHPARMAGRILGQGDIETLTEKLAAAAKEERERSASDARKDDYTFDQLIAELRRYNKVGPLNEVIKMLPGAPDALENIDLDLELQLIEAMVGSMTSEERRQPEIIDRSRRTRIAQGSGTKASQVACLVDDVLEERKHRRRQASLGSRKKSTSRDKNKKNNRRTNGGGRVTAKGQGAVTPRRPQSRANGATVSRQLRLRPNRRPDDDQIAKWASELDQLGN